MYVFVVTFCISWYTRTVNSVKLVNNDFVSISEAARILSVSRPTVYRLIREGQLTAVRYHVYRPRGPIQLARAEVEELARPR